MEPINAGTWLFMTTPVDPYLEIGDSLAIGAYDYQNDNWTVSRLQKTIGKLEFEIQIEEVDRPFAAYTIYIGSDQDGNKYKVTRTSEPWREEGEHELLYARVEVSPIKVFYDLKWLES